MPEPDPTALVECRHLSFGYAERFVLNDINLTRCGPVQMRQMLEAVDAMRQAGLAFVPIPVLNDRDRANLYATMSARLESIEAAAAKKEAE